jgi:hypothetical protein
MPRRLTIACAVACILHERPRDAHEDLGGLYGQHRRGFGALERDPLGHELAERDVEGRDDREGNRDRDRVRGRLGDLTREVVQLRNDDRRDRRLADPPESQAGHRHAELRGGDVAIGRRDRAPHGARPSVAFGNQLIDARLADRDDRELRGDEKAVGAYEGEQPCEAPRDTG